MKKTMKKTMKKILSLLLVLTMTIGIAPLSGFTVLKLPEWLNFENLFKVEAKATTNGIYTYIVSNDNVIITDCNTSASGAITIPNTFEGYPVTSIDTSAFKDCKSITSITFPDSITNIGNSAFKGCTGIVSILIPKGVTDVGDSAFYGCTKLTSVTIPDSIMSIGQSAFANCTKITDVYYTGEINNWGRILFNNTTSNPFYYAENFYINNVLATDVEITVPEGVTQISVGAFNNWTWLNSITIPDSVISIESRAFYGCTGLKEITIPDSVISIKNYAFYGCKGLKEITMPVSAEINYGSANVFSGCTNIETAFLSKGTGEMQSFGESTSSNITTCYKYTPWYNSRTTIREIEFEDGITKIGPYAFYGLEKLTSIVIPDSVTIIGGHAFYGCTGIRELVIPASAEIIDGGFGNCSNIERITITKGTGIMQTYKGTSSSYEDGVYYRYAPWYQSKNSIKEIEIEEGITNISAYAFHGCTGLASIVIPDSVTCIGLSAFESCNNLTSITLPDNIIDTSVDAFVGGDAFLDTAYYNDPSNWEDGVLYLGCHLIKGEKTLTDECVIKEGTKSISTSAFSSCEKLTSVVIPDSVILIGRAAFSNCTGLEELVMPASAKISNYTYTFNNCTNIEKVTLTKGTGVMQNYAHDLSGTKTDSCYQYTPWYYSKNSIKEIVIEEGVTNIGNYAFYQCTSLKSVNIPDSVTTIGWNAFGGCVNLTSIIIPDNVTDISDRAFYNCKGLKEIVMPVSAKIYNSEYTFYGCDSVEKIRLTVGTGVMQNYGTDTSPSATDTYYKYTPWYCKDSLKEIEIGYVKNIGSYAFYNIWGITSISIPDSVTTIGDYAFSHSGLSSVLIGNGVKNIRENAFYDCDNLSNVYYRGTEKEWDEIAIEDMNYSLYEATIHFICRSCLQGCYNAYETVSPTCTEQGYTTYRCSNCNRAYVYSFVKAPGHNYKLTVTPPNCTDRGYTTYACTEGDDTYVSNYVDKLGHNYESTVTPPTCTEQGYTTYVCTKGDDTYVGDYVSALGHTDGEWKVTKEPTCTEKGEKILCCAVCKEAFDTREVSELGHDYEATITEPTCTERGYTTYVCSKGDDTYIDNYVDAMGHTDGEWKETTEPTCTKMGEETLYCSVCKVGFDTREVSELGHDYEATITKPTCTEKGYTTYVCSRGDNTYFDNYVDVMGHTPSEWRIENENTENAKLVMRCLVCNAVLEEKAIPENSVVAMIKTSDGTVIDADIVESGNADFAFDNIEDGEYTVVVSKTGYVSKEYQITAVEGEVSFEVEELNKPGDLNGDGKVNAIDVARANAHAKGVNALSGYEFDCVDVNGDGRVNAIDVALINAHSKGTKSLW